MQITKLHAKIHRATVTSANLNYEGSIAIDKVLLDACGMSINEKIDVYNITNGARFSTYIIEGSQGDICLNGAAAHKVSVGDLVILCCYAIFEKDEFYQPKVIFVDENNKIKEIKNYENNQLNT